ncbi:MAG: peptidoglycan D,D-transpeptidase FtsI family protein, partial [Anaerolineae bacterium]
MRNNIQKRIWVIIAGLIFATVIIVGRLFVFMVLDGPNWREKAINYTRVVDKPERGIIYDRNGAILTANTQDYRVGVSPAFVTKPDSLATSLTTILQIPKLQVLNMVDPPTSDEEGNENPPPTYVLISRRVNSETAEMLRGLEDQGVQLEPIPRRFYPQDELLCHTLGYLDLNEEGKFGLEAYYQQEMAGQEDSEIIDISPLSVQRGVIAREGADLVLTIDRSIQHLVEQQLKQALEIYGAESGTVIVMDPRTGAILALANMPCYSPANYFEYVTGDGAVTDDVPFPNPAVNAQFEPGSVMKLVTMAAALDSNTVLPSTTYYDAGSIEVGGHVSYNWDKSAPGTTDMTTLLARSLNVGAATIATWMGTDIFYEYLQRFNFGRPTGIDLAGEASGIMPLPGDENWAESFLATNAYGQSLAVTPIQMVSAIAAIANDGYQMQPYLVQEIHAGNGVFMHQPDVQNRPITPKTAELLTNMAVQAVAREVPEAQVPGYTIAGKTGTAQIPGEFGYLEDDVIGSFVGWLPADNPEIVVFVKLDKPTSARWGSQTAAPLFADLVEELVVLLDIPPDNVRLRADVMAARQEN